MTMGVVRIRFENFSGRKIELFLSHLDPEAIDGLRAAAMTAPAELEHGVLVVTSAADGDHSENSLHYQGRAWDLRIHKLTRRQAKAWAGRIKKHLHGDWQVIVEADHMHMERDR